MKIDSKIIIMILVSVGTLSVGISYGTLTQGSVDSFDRAVKMQDGKPLFWVDNATSIARTNTYGNNNSTGSYITERGYSGIIFQTLGTQYFGTGKENARVTASGIQMATGNSYYWQDLAISLSRTDTTGANQGNFMTVRGYDGIIFKTLGTAGYGTGTEVMRISAANSNNVGIGTTTPAQKLEVNGNIQADGNLTTSSTNKEFKISAPSGVPICIGICP